MPIDHVRKLPKPEILKVSQGLNAPTPNNTYVGNYYTALENNKNATLDRLGNYIMEISESGSCVYSIKINRLTIKIDKVSTIESNPNDIVHVNRTKNYSTTEEHKYIILDEYKHAVIRGTSLTFNDLRYFPNVDGHRLYVKDDCTQYDPDPRSVIYYREMNKTANHKDAVASWVYDNFKNKNCLYLLTGPCFVY